MIKLYKIDRNSVTVLTKKKKKGGKNKPTIVVHSNNKEMGGKSRIIAKRYLSQGYKISVGKCKL